MAERRALIEGLKAAPGNVDVVREKQFVYAGEPATPNSPQATAPSAPANKPRAPISTRIRADLAAALKRASLERQLSGTEPNTLQDILEAAIEPWLRNNGYLS